MKRISVFLVMILTFLQYSVCGMSFSDVFNTQEKTDKKGNKIYGQYGDVYRFRSVKDEARAYLCNEIEIEEYNRLSNIAHECKRSMPDNDKFLVQTSKQISTKPKQSVEKQKCSLDIFNKKFLKKISDIDPQKFQIIDTFLQYVLQDKKSSVLFSNKTNKYFMSALNQDVTKEMLKVIICKMKTRHEFVKHVLDIFKEIGKASCKNCYCIMMYFIENFSNVNIDNSKRNITLNSVNNFNKDEIHNVDNYVKCIVSKMFVGFSNDNKIIKYIKKLKDDIKTCDFDANVCGVILQNKLLQQKISLIYNEFVKCISDLKDKFTKIEIIQHDEDAAITNYFSENLLFHSVRLSLNSTGLYYIDYYDDNNVYCRLRDETVESTNVHEFSHTLRNLVFNADNIDILRNNKSNIDKFIASIANASYISSSDWTDDNEFLTISGCFYNNNNLYYSFFNENFYNIASTCKKGKQGSYVINIPSKGNKVCNARYRMWHVYFVDEKDQPIKLLEYGTKDFTTKWIEMCGLCSVEYSGGYVTIKEINVPNVDLPKSKRYFSTQK